MTDSEPQPAPGRRAGRRAAPRSRRTPLDVTAVLALVLPLACAGAIALVRSAEPETGVQLPTETVLTTATIVCPPGLPDAPALALTSVAEDARGSVAIGLGEDAEQVKVAAGETTSIDVGAALTVTGEDALAPGLVAARVGGPGLAATSCRPPSSRQWFTGVGAGAGHTSVLELTNPDRGTALVDVTVLGRDGVVDAPRLRGVAVAGGDSVRLDLGQLIPRKGDLALEVVTSQGRVGVSLLDRVDRLGSEPLTQDWLPAQAEPRADQLLLGIAPGDGRRFLTLANPGIDEIRAEVRIVTADSVFAPEALDEVRLPPQSARRVPVTAVLGGASAEGALGLEVRATGPITASLRSIVRGDLSHAAAEAIERRQEATLLLPPGSARGPQAITKTLLVAGATRAGTVTVVSRSADGSALRTDTVEITPGRGLQVELPAGAVLAQVSTARTDVSGAVLVTRAEGATVLPLEVPITAGLVPGVRPGLP